MYYIGLAKTTEHSYPLKVIVVLGFILTILVVNVIQLTLMLIPLLIFLNANIFIFTLFPLHLLLWQAVPIFRTDDAYSALCKHSEYRYFLYYYLMKINSFAIDTEEFFIL